MPIDLNSADALVVLITLVLLGAVYVRTKLEGSALPYPPGPKRLPLLGNLLHFPKTPEWVTFDRWCKDLDTDILYLRALGSEFLILNSWESIDDLLEKRSSIYSSRYVFCKKPSLELRNWRYLNWLHRKDQRWPCLTCHEMGWSWMFSITAYGEAWRDRRRAFTKYFHPANTSVHQPHALKFVREMLPGLLDKPEDFRQITRHSVTAFTIAMAYGLPIKKADDPYVSLAARALTSVNEACLPGNFLVNVLPILKHVPELIPGAGFKRQAREWKLLQEMFRIMPFEKTLQDIRTGTAKPSFVSNNMERLSDAVITEEEKQEKEVVIVDTAALIFQAGADTTLASVDMFFAAMLLFPEAQKRAQEELDQVLNERLPEFDDEKDLPYITALVKELLRWKQIVPLAVPHATTEDDIYRGYHIPKGIYVMPNSWALLQDEKHFPDPSRFIPERFLDNMNGTLRTDIRDPTNIIFGYGRRVCPGSHVALSYLWIMVATILSVFEIGRAFDENGTPIEPCIDFHEGVVCEPVPFRCSIKVRSKESQELIAGIEGEE